MTGDYQPTPEFAFPGAAVSLAVWNPDLLRPPDWDVRAAYWTYLGAQEHRLRTLLGRWVSGLDPTAVYRPDVNGVAQLVGLAVAGDPDARLVVQLGP